MSDIRDKLRKLRAKSEDSAFTEQEAQVYAEKLQSTSSQCLTLLTRSRTTSRTDRRSSTAQAGVAISRTQWAGSWVLRSASRQELTGERTQDSRSTQQLFRYLERSCVTIPRARFPGDTPSARRAEKGVAIGLCERLYRMRQQLPEARALVPLEHANAEAAQERMMPNIKTANLSQTIDSQEAYAGYQLADTVQIQDEVK